MVRGFFRTWLGWKEHRFFGVSSQKGFTREPLGEPSTFKLWHPGHNSRGLV
jgi:hypothetical protein